jgi:hypothetical protein
VTSRDEAKAMTRTLYVGLLTFIVVGLVYFIALGLVHR